MSPGTTLQLDGAGVLVTGVTGGLGQALARELDSRGARVVGAGRDEDRLNGIDVLTDGWSGDLREPGAAEQVVEFAATVLSELHVVINAAGVVAFGPATELDPAVAQELLETDALLPMLLASAALNRLKAGGVFVNLTGIAGEQSVANMAAYCGAKAAAASFMAAAAREARRAGLRVLDARPPHTETGLTSRALAGTAPTMSTGLKPERVATVTCDAIVDGTRDLPPVAFTDTNDA